MTELVFVDTNVFVYARDAAEPGKQPVAAIWLERLWREQRGRTCILVRPRCSRQSRSSHIAATGCFPGSAASRAYTNTFVSTKTSSVMQFFPSGISLALLPKLHRRLGEKGAHRPVILMQFLHALHEHLADDAR